MKISKEHTDERLEKWLGNKERNEVGGRKRAGRLGAHDGEDANEDEANEDENEDEDIDDGASAEGSAQDEATASEVEEA